MIVLVDLKLIDDNPFQTRSSYGPEAIRDLADNIASLRDARPDTLGLIHVPVARPVGHKGEPLRNIDISECRFQLAAGHCRLRAFRLLEQEDHDLWWRMPLDVSDLDDQAMADVAWSENQKRRDLSPIERARALDNALGRFGWTQEQIGQRWGLSQSAVANAIRLLALPPWAVEAIHQGEITERHGRALLTLLPIAPPWPEKTILLNPATQDLLTAEELDAKVRLVVDVKTRALEKAPWWSDFPGWAPSSTFKTDVRGSCQGCSCQVTVLKQPRCTDPQCYTSKSSAYNRDVAGPTKAADLHNHMKPWERRSPPWATCNAGCGRSRDEASGDWFVSSGTWICPYCWQAAQLPPPPKPAPPPPPPPAAISRPVSAQAGASPRPVPDMRPVSPQVGAAPRPVPDMRPAGVAGQPAAIGPAPAASTPRSDPVVILNARIYPGPDLSARRVLLSIAEEGKIPAIMTGTVYENLIDLIREKCDRYFSTPPDPGGDETLYEDSTPADDTGADTGEEE